MLGKKTHKSLQLIFCFPTYFTSKTHKVDLYAKQWEFVFKDKKAQLYYYVDKFITQESENFYKEIVSREDTYFSVRGFVTNVLIPIGDNLRALEIKKLHFLDYQPMIEDLAYESL